MMRCAEVSACLIDLSQQCEALMLKYPTIFLLSFRYLVLYASHPPNGLHSTRMVQGIGNNISQLGGTTNSLWKTLWARLEATGSMLRELYLAMSGANASEVSMQLPHSQWM